MKFILVFITLFFSLSSFANSELSSRNCFLRGISLNPQTNPDLKIHLYENDKFTGDPLVKFEDKVYLREGGKYAAYELLEISLAYEHQGRSVINRKLFTDNRLRFLKNYPDQDPILLFCSNEKENEYFVEHGESKLFFKLDKKKIDDGYYKGSIVHDDPYYIRKFSFRDTTFRNARTLFQNCLEKQGVDCERKQDERNAKLMLYVVDTYTQVDCIGEMPRISDFDEKKKYNFKDSIVEKATSIIRAGEDYAINYYFKLNLDGKIDYKFTMFATRAFNCEGWNVEGIDVSYHVGSDGKGYFEFVSPSVSANK